jgi:hypothetical protein
MKILAKETSESPTKRIMNSQNKFQRSKFSQKLKVPFLQFSLLKQTHQRTLEV